MWQKRFLSLGVGLVFTVLSLIASLYIAEWVLSSIDPRASLPRNGVHDGIKYTWGHVLRRNSINSRGPEPTIPKPAGVFRVLALGDSLTWGAGVAEEERYTEIAEGLLRSADLPQELEIVNAAASGAPLIGYRDKLFEIGDHLEPDLLTVGFCFNDPQPKGQDSSEERRRYIIENRKVLRFTRKMKRYFPYLGERTWKAFMNWGKRSGAYPDWPDALDRVYDPSSDQWKDFVQGLRDIKAWSDERGLPTPFFLILNQGSSTLEPTRYSDPDPFLKRIIGWYDQVEQAARDAGFITVDHRELFAKELDGVVLGVNELDGHPSPAEHDIYGRTLAEQILARKESIFR